MLARGDPKDLSCTIECSKKALLGPVRPFWALLVTLLGTIQFLLGCNGHPLFGPFGPPMALPPLSGLGFNVLDLDESLQKLRASHFAHPTGRSNADLAGQMHDE